MKVIDVNKQVRLSLAKTVELVLSGVKFRLFRAAVTVAIVALAVAFLMTMLSESVIARNISAAIDKQIAPRQLFVFWLSRLTQSMPPGQLTEELATIQPGGDRWVELQNWGQLDDDQMNVLTAFCRRKIAYDRYFAALDEGDRQAMVARASGEEIYVYLGQPEAFDAFAREQGTVGREFPESIDQFRAFLAEWPAMKELRDEIFAGHAGAARQFRTEVLGDVSPNVFLSQADEALLEETARLGFRMTTADLAVVREQAALTVDAELISNLLKAPLLRTSLMTHLRKESATDVGPQELFGMLKSGGEARWFLAEIQRIRQRISEQYDDLVAREQAPAEEVALMKASRELIFHFDLSAERVQEVARDRLQARNLAAVEAKVSQTAGGGFMGFSSRTIALICVSLLVCTMGVVNAMLMSVAERFREIATMKCLGATDGFIMVNFMLESCVQGIAGGIVGAVLGLMLGIIRSCSMYGAMALSHVPLGDVLIVALVSLVLGVVLSVLAAVYPALVAARLAPMEAMRIE